MTNKIQNLFENIHAKDELKEKTLSFLYTEIKKRSQKKSYFKVNKFIATCTLVIILFGLSYNAYFTEITYIDIDVNPSVELTLNRFGHVLKAVSYNSDGDIILKNINFKNSNYSKIIKLIFDNMVSKNYLQENNLISISVQTKKNEDTMLLEIKNTVNLYLQQHHFNTATDIFSVSEEVKSHSHENNVTPAKYLAITELQKFDPTTTFDSCKNHTIFELKELTNHHKAELENFHNKNGHH